MHMYIEEYVVVILKVNHSCGASPHEVSTLCLCVSLTCSGENASIRIVEHWMCGESWLAIKDL